MCAKRNVARITTCSVANFIFENYVKLTKSNSKLVFSTVFLHLTVLRMIVVLPFFVLIREVGNTDFTKLLSDGPTKFDPVIVLSSEWLNFDWSYWGNFCLQNSSTSRYLETFLHPVLSVLPNATILPTCQCTEWLTYQNLAL